jgi:hypothetical protein
MSPSEELGTLGCKPDSSAAETDPAGGWNDALAAFTNLHRGVVSLSRWPLATTAAAG